MSDHSRSPVEICVATMRPEWPAANTTPLSIAGRAASDRLVSAELVRERARFSDQTAVPSLTFSAKRSPEGYGTTTTSPDTAGLTFMIRLACCGSPRTVHSSEPSTPDRQ